MEPRDHAAVPADQLGPLCALDDDTRRALYEHVVASPAPVTRDEASAGVGVDRSLAAYHLDRLVAEGLLVASFARPPGRRGGPGAGRPAKHYQRGDRELAVSVPPRDYQLAAEVLARAAEGDPTGALQRSAEQAARTMGRELAAGSADVVDQLRRLGFEPAADPGAARTAAVIRLRNCPFHRLARDHTELVCRMNLALLTGLVEALGADVQARLDPAEGACCVTLVPAAG